MGVMLGRAIHFLFEFQPKPFPLQLYLSFSFPLYIALPFPLSVSLLFPLSFQVLFSLSLNLLHPNLYLCQLLHYRPLEPNHKIVNTPNLPLYPLKPLITLFPSPIMILLPHRLFLQLLLLFQIPTLIILEDHRLSYRQPFGHHGLDLFDGVIESSLLNISDGQRVEWEISVLDGARFREVGDNYFILECGFLEEGLVSLDLSVFGRVLWLDVFGCCGDHLSLGQLFGFLSRLGWGLDNWLDLPRLWSLFFRSGLRLRDFIFEYRETVNGCISYSLYLIILRFFYQINNLRVFFCRPFQNQQPIEQINQSLPHIPVLILDIPLHQHPHQIILFEILLQGQQQTQQCLNQLNLHLRATYFLTQHRTELTLHPHENTRREFFDNTSQTSPYKHLFTTPLKGPLDHVEPLQLLLFIIKGHNQPRECCKHFCCLIGISCLLPQNMQQLLKIIEHLHSVYLYHGRIDLHELLLGSIGGGSVSLEDSEHPLSLLDITLGKQRLDLEVPRGDGGDLLELGELGEESLVEQSLGFLLHLVGRFDYYSKQQWEQQIEQEQINRYYQQ